MIKNIVVKISDCVRFQLINQKNSFKPEHQIRVLLLIQQE